MSEAVAVARLVIAEAEWELQGKLVEHTEIPITLIELGVHIAYHPSPGTGLYQWLDLTLPDSR